MLRVLRLLHLTYVTKNGGLTGKKPNKISVVVVVVSIKISKCYNVTGIWGYRTIGLQLFWHLQKVLRPKKKIFKSPCYPKNAVTL